MGKSPFWLLAVGLGVAFMVRTGRAQALYNVITSPVDTSRRVTITPGVTPPTTTPGAGAGNCPDGYVYDPTKLKCVLRPEG